MCVYLRLPLSAVHLCMPFIRIEHRLDCDAVCYSRRAPARLSNAQALATHERRYTTGGLCPGLNNVIRAVVMCLWHRYGVRKIYGFKYGYQGLNPATSEHVMLTPEVVGGMLILRASARLRRGKFYKCVEWLKL